MVSGLFPGDNTDSVPLGDLNTMSKSPRLKWRKSNNKTTDSVKNSTEEELAVSVADETAVEEDESTMGMLMIPVSAWRISSGGKFSQPSAAETAALAFIMPNP